MISSLLNLRTPGVWVTVIPFATALLIACALTGVTLRICRRHGWIAKPRADRWHRGAPCLFGGVPLWVSFLITAALFLPLHHRLLWELVGVSSLMFLLGLGDDIHPLPPRVRFLCQLLAASLVLCCGLVYPLRDSLVINITISLLWMVGIINAFNLLDNMDGLSAGVGLISALYLAFLYLSRGSLANMTLLLILAGSLSGFLVFNFKPARIFMGDAGSLFLGAILATSSMLEVTHLSGISAFLFVPMLLLAVPIFDTFFVSITRRLRGQAISQGGTDHSSHRLVTFGLEERSAVLVLYVLSAGSGAVALLLRYLYSPYSTGLIVFWFFLLLVFGIHLFQPMSMGYSSQKEREFGLIRRVLTRDTLALILDPAALSLSYYLAYFIRFTKDLRVEELPGFFKSIPVVVAIKFICLLMCGIYRRSWWRGSSGDVFRLSQATVLGEVLAIVTLVGLHRFAGYSRVVFALDFIISIILLLGVRKSFPLFRELIYSLQLKSSFDRRVFIVGTSQNVETSLLFLKERGIKCIGLIDSNGGIDLGRRLWGFPVLGQLNDIPTLAKRHGVSEIIVPDSEPPPYSQEELESIFKGSHLQVTRLGLYKSMF